MSCLPFPGLFNSLRLDADVTLLLLPRERSRCQRKSTGRIHCAFFDVEIEGVLTLGGFDRISHVTPDDLQHVCIVGFTGVQVIHLTRDRNVWDLSNHGAVKAQKSRPWSGTNLPGWIKSQGSKIKPSFNYKLS